jgi:cytochrome c-type protein NapC
MPTASVWTAFQHSAESLSRLAHGKGMLTLGFSGALLGIGGWAGIDVAMDRTSTTEFCLSCHEMKIMQEEFAKSIHFNNRSGVRLDCGDGHIQKGGLAKLISKVQALDDVYAHFIGTVDTPEKFEARREDMAHTVRTAMKEDNSQACRNCHAFNAMDFSKQADRPRRKHNEALETGQTCIDCHKGIAHLLPSGLRD